MIFIFLKYIKLPPNWSTFDEIPEMIDLKRLAPFPDLFATEKTRIVRLLFMSSIQYHKEAGRGEIENDFYLIWCLDFLHFCNFLIKKKQLTKHEFFSLILC